jgi:carboxymethylenebutenolidase
MGGHWALWLAQQRPQLPIRATETFYGSRDGDYAHSQSAFLGHFAEEDEWVSDAALRKLRKSLESAGRLFAFHVNTATGHWFFEADAPDAYDAGAAEAAWERTLAFLRKQLK